AWTIHDRARDNAQCHSGGDDLLNTLSVLRRREGFLDDAERFADAMIDCLQREHGPDHVVVADYLSLRIGVWIDQGRYAEAEQLARQSLTKRGALHGDDSSAVDNALLHLAAVLYERGKLAEAVEGATRSLEMRTKAYGRLHDSVAASLTLLGEIQLAGGDAHAAEASQQGALAIWQKVMGSD